MIEMSLIMCYTKIVILILLILHVHKCNLYVLPYWLTPAIACAINDFPLPGGPFNSRPRGDDIPKC